MKESEFIAINKDKWLEYEKLLSEKNTDPDTLRDIFIQVTDDLSYARSNYANRSVRVYLNQLAQQIFEKLNKRKKISLEPIIEFFTKEVPQLMYYARREMIIAFLVLCLSVGVGIYSSIQDPDFARQILGDRYVNMTKTNIENGEPMAVYRSAKEVDSFLMILYNNARIDVLILSLGMLFGIGSLFLLISNGIMLGVFQYFFYANGGFQESVLTIWLHGTIEISTLALMGGVGMVAGKGLLFPGSYTRFQSFRISAGNASKLLLAVLPFTFIAAIIESFITRQTGAPDLIKILFILICLLLVVYYFVLLPIKVNQRLGKNPSHERLRNPVEQTPIKLNEVKSIGTIISQSFIAYKSNLGRNIGLSFGLAIVLCITIFFGFHDSFVTPSWPIFTNIEKLILEGIFDKKYQFSDNSLDNFKSIYVIFLSIAILIFVYWTLKKVSKAPFTRDLRWRVILSGVLLVGICVVYAAADRDLGASTMVLYLMYVLLLASVTLILQSAYYHHKTKMFRLFLFKPQSHILLFLAAIFVSFFIMLLFNSALMILTESILKDLMPFNRSLVAQLLIGFRIIIFHGVFFALIPFWTELSLLHLTSFVEQEEAPELKSHLLSLKGEHSKL